MTVGQKKTSSSGTLMSNGACQCLLQVGLICNGALSASQDLMLRTSLASFQQLMLQISLTRKCALQARPAGTENEDKSFRYKSSVCMVHTTRVLLVVFAWPDPIGPSMSGTRPSIA